MLRQLQLCLLWAAPQRLLPSAPSPPAPASLPQGLLSVDYGGLSTLTMLALQEVIKRVDALSEAQATLQLTAAGHLGDHAAAAAGLQGLQRGASGSSASAASVASMAQLEADRDEYMEEGGGSEAEGEGGVAEGAAAQPTAGDLEGLSDGAVVERLVQALGEPPSAKGVFKVRGAWRGREWGVGWQHGWSANRLPSTATALLHHALSPALCRSLWGR